MEKLASRTIHPLERVCPEVIAHRLNHVGLRMMGGQPQEIIQCSREYGHGQSFFQHDTHRFLPYGKSLRHFQTEMPVEQHVRQSRCTVISLGNIVQESRADDAAGTPQQSDGRKVQVPFIGVTRRAHQCKSLCIPHQTSRIKSGLQRSNSILIIINRMILNVHIMFGHQHTQALFRRQITCKHSLGNYIERSIKLQRIDNAPTPCTLLSGSIQYAVFMLKI